MNYESLSRGGYAGASLGHCTAVLQFDTVLGILTGLTIEFQRSDDILAAVAVGCAGLTAAVGTYTVAHVDGLGRELLGLEDSPRRCS